MVIQLLVITPGDLKAFGSNRGHSFGITAAGGAGWQISRMDS